MFESEVFRKQLSCIEESTCDIVGTFRRPGNCPPLLALVTLLLPINDEARNDAHVVSTGVRLC